MAKKLDRGQGRAIKWVLKISTLTIFVGIGLLYSSWAFAYGVDDSFDTYSLGDLSGQGGWETLTASCLVSNEQSFSSPNSVKTLSSANCSNFKSFDAAASGSQKFYFYQPSASANYNGFTFRIREVQSDRITFSAYKTSATKGEIFLSGIGGSTKNYDLDTWNYIVVEWAFPNQVRYDLNDTGFTNWFTASPSWTTLSTIYLANWQNAGWPFNVFFDHLGTPPPPGFSFSVASPPNESIIEDIEDEITFEWSGWDFEDIWTEFLFWFVEKNTGIATNRIIYNPTTESGQISYPFSDFEFEKNGDYYLKARRGCVKYGQELIYPDYWIKIDIEGWEYLFEMPDWETWYSENVEKFATSTAVFSGFAGFISPIFNKIGEFGDKLLQFLDTDEAYGTGYDLGKFIPIFSHYVDEIEVFFGGFPIIKIFLAFMVILIGIFIVRLILKFIPFLG